MPFGIPGIQHYAGLHPHFVRDAGNRTRATRTPCAHTAIMLHPENPLYKRGAIIIEIIETSFIKILRDGPAVSLNGSPTVSPTTAAL